MSDTCREFERCRGGRGLANRTAWVQHLESCATCQEQDSADRALRALFAHVRPPELPPYFALQCAIRARALMRRVFPPETK